MRFTTKRTTAAIVASAFALVGSAALSADAGAAVAKPRHHHKCITYSGTDHSHLTIRDAASPGGGPGDSVVYHDELFDAAGTQYGTMDGTALVFTDPKTGQLKEALASVGFVPEGTVLGSGHISVVGASKGEEQVLRAVGTTGKLRGKTGTWKFTLIGQPEPNLTIFKGEIRLCG
jgi:hypothetical protein